MTGTYAELLTVMEQEEDSDAYIDTLEGIQDAINVKAENIVKWMKNLEAESNAFKEESKRLADKAKAIENKRIRLKDYLESCMKNSNVEKLKAGLFSLNMQNNPPSVEIEDENKVPQQYRVPQPDKIDKKAMLDDLKKGVDLGAGIKLKQEKSLRIR